MVLCYHRVSFLPVQETSKVTVATLISWYKLVSECQLLKPDYGIEAAKDMQCLYTQSAFKSYICARSNRKRIPSLEEDSFNSCKSKQPHSKRHRSADNSITVRLMFLQLLKSKHLTQHHVWNLWILSRHHFALLEMQGMVSIALNNLSFSCKSFINVSRSWQQKKLCWQQPSSYLWQQQSSSWVLVTSRMVWSSDVYVHFTMT